MLHPVPAARTSSGVLHDRLLLSDLEFLILELLYQQPLSGGNLLHALLHLKRQLNGNLLFTPSQLHPTLRDLLAVDLIRCERRIIAPGVERIYYHPTLRASKLHTAS